MRTRKWQQRDFWRTIAFREYRDSREWRYLLALNPSYDIRYRPAAGVPIAVSGDIGAGEVSPEPRGRSGLLKTPGMTLDPITNSNNSPLIVNVEPYFPWDSQEEYNDRLGDYTASALLGRDRSNGWSIDSRQALSDSQR